MTTWSNNSTNRLGAFYATENCLQIGGVSGTLDSISALTDGQIVIGKTGDAPIGATLGSGNNITVTSGAGTASIAVTGNTQYAPLVGGAAGQLASIGPLGSGELLIGSAGVNPVAGSLASSGGTITITKTAGGINLEAAGTSSGLAWSEITDASKTIVTTEGYIANKATLITFTLPATASVGHVFALVGIGAGMWRVSQAASQYIRLGSNVTTTGTGGYILATDQYDCIEAVCIVANNGWCIRTAVGTIDLL